MKKRVVSAVIFTLMWVALLLVNNRWFDTAIMFVLSIVANYEFFKAFKAAGYNPISWIGYLGCALVVLMNGTITDSYQVLLTKILVPLMLIGAFVYMLLSNVKRTIIDIAITVFSIIYIPFMFSFTNLILGLSSGRFYILYALFGAFASDTFAFLVGSKIGKTKLAPDISPNKTVEGSLGGVLGVVIIFIIISLLGNGLFNMDINVVYWIFVAIVASIAGQFGDLTASAIKRFCKIKDFGNIMPGHGGVLDRFDSLLFVSPIIYIFIKLYI